MLPSAPIKLTLCTVGGGLVSVSVSVSELSVELVSLLTEELSVVVSVGTVGSVSVGEVGSVSVGTVGTVSVGVVVAVSVGTVVTTEVGTVVITEVGTVVTAEVGAVVTVVVGAVSAAELVINGGYFRLGSLVSAAEVVEGNAAVVFSSYVTVVCVLLWVLESAVAVVSGTVVAVVSEAS